MNSKYMFSLLLLLLLFFSGCSSNEPQIAGISVINKNLDKDDNLSFDLIVSIGRDKNLDQIEDGILKVTFLNSGFEWDTPFGFFPSQQNDKVKIGLIKDHYSNFGEVALKIEMIQGTKILDSQDFTFKND